MKSLDPKALEAASRAFRRMHNSVCYPSASENEADWAASEIVSAYLAALDAPSNPPLSDLSSLRKGAEVAVTDAARDLLFHLELYDFSERDPSGELNEKMADLKAALVSGSREDGADA